MVALPVDRILVRHGMPTPAWPDRPICEPIRHDGRGGPGELVHVDVSGSGWAHAHRAGRHRGQPSTTTTAPTPPQGPTTITRVDNLTGHYSYERVCR